jgi:GalNAc-alpha-(1->4)-GalNAc-alpha-(1->3)-diNAcBac-PP-undecaprenol alpha-1,4-N-acetyl-D-galactosaminyltransferase
VCKFISGLLKLFVESISNMNIVFLVSSLDGGGAERVATTLCNEWAKNDHRVTLVATFSGGGVPFYTLHKRVNVVFLADLVNTRRKTMLTYFCRLLTLRKIIQQQDTDVVVSFLSNVNVAAILATPFTKIPVVICERSDPVSRQIPRIWSMFCAMFYRFADVVVVQTDSVMDNINRLYPSLKLVACVPNPLPQSMEEIHRDGSAKTRRVLLSLGRLVPEKQIDHSINAFAALAGDRPDWDLHLYGDGPSRAELEDLVGKLGLNDRVIFKGQTTEPWDVMAKADAFVMTSRSEGFPNSLLEAMAVGLPCVVYDCPSGPHDITRGGQDALLVPLNHQNALTQSLQRVLENDALRRELGNRARASVLARYELNVVLRQWNEVFRQLGVTV